MGGRQRGDGIRDITKLITLKLDSQTHTHTHAYIPTLDAVLEQIWAYLIIWRLGWTPTYTQIHTHGAHRSSRNEGCACGVRI